jgi:amino acid adenylation domain-containing protein
MGAPIYNRHPEDIQHSNWWWLDAVTTEPEQPALISPDGEVTSRAALSSAVRAAALYLRDQGIGSGDRLALACAPGPNQAATLLACLGFAVSVPLTQTGPAGAVEENLRRLKVTWVIVDRYPSDAVLQAAETLGLPVLNLEPFTLPSAPLDWRLPLPAEDDVALLMQTSGTTSRPKVVPLTHANLLAGARSVIRTLELAPSDRALAAMPLFHIHGLVATLLAPLLAGGSVICCNERAADKLLSQLSLLRPTWASASPTMLLALLEAADQKGARPAHNFRFLRSVTMPLARETHVRLMTAFQVPIFAVYGMTEASSPICSYQLPSDGAKYRPDAVGPTVGPELTVLNPAGEHCPVGTAGEIAIRGPSVTLGYEDAEHSGWILDRQGERWFLSGDQGYLDDHGHLTLTGRVKEMVNRGGMKVSPLRVDEALNQHPAVQEAVAFAVPHPTLGEDLMAAVVLRAGATADENALRDHLIGILPAHEVPSGIIFVDALPRGNTGKLQRIGLAKILGDRLLSKPLPLHGATEHAVASIFSEVLGLDVASREANFFLLGGDSLSSLGVIHRLEQRLGLELDPTLLFSYPQVRSLSHRLDQLRSGANAEVPEFTEIPIAAALPNMGPDGGETFPASFGQARLWFLQQMEPTRSGYHLIAMWRLRGELNREALNQALSSLIEQHPTLRTSFRWQSDSLFQIIHPPTRFWLEVTALGGSEPDQIIEHWLRQEGSTPFDLGSGLLIRGRLLAVDRTEHVLMLNLHHIASDGWSGTVLAEDLVSLYNSICAGSAPTLRRLDLHYQDYAVWQRERIKGKRLEILLEYWEAQLEGLEPFLLPSDKPHGMDDGQDGASRSFGIDASLVNRFETLCKAEGATLHMGLLAVVSLLLHRVYEQDDFAIGVPMWGRDRPSLEPLIGFFVNTLPIRIRFIAPLSFRQLLAQVRDTSIEAYAHQELPFDQIVKAFRAGRDGSRNPLFQVMLQFIATPLPTLEGMSCLKTERRRIPPVATRFDLEFVFRREADGRIEGELIYDRGLFFSSTIERMVERFFSLFNALLDAPDAPTAVLNLLSPPERASINIWRVGTHVPELDQTIDEMFARQVQRSPQAIALVFEGQQLTYAEVDRQADRMARMLRELCVGPDVIVGVSLARSVELFISVLAILKAGGAYLPIDPEWPQQRRSEVMQVSAATVLITDRDLDSTETGAPLHILKPSELNSQDFLDLTLIHGHSRPGSLAYVLYTSGSTGQPKGVAMPHKALTNLLDWQKSCSGGAMRTFQFASLGFDVSFQEIFSTWIVGGTLFIANDQVRRDPSLMLSMLESEGIERLFLPVVMLEYLAKTAIISQRFPASLREVCVAGETLRITPIIRQFFEGMPECVLWNHYGPTETHVVTAHQLSREPNSWPDLPPIGKPIDNTQAYILDRNMQETPIGIAGDIWIGGEALARGYWRNPALTEERFVENPFDKSPNKKIYRTGDRGRWRDNGQLEFLGRTDNQVKIRGHRIELEEIEAVLASHPDVFTAAVVACGAAGAPITIVGFGVGLPGRNLTPEDLRSWLRTRLPGPMIPSEFFMLLDLPVNTNGKVDRKSLAVLAKTTVRSPKLIDNEDEVVSSIRSIDKRDGQEPQTLLEEQIVRIWQKIFISRDVRLTSDFFELGGDSLMAVQMAIELEELLGHAVPITLLFKAPTIQLLAQSLTEEAWIPAWTSLVVLKSSGHRIPLFCVHGVGGEVFNFAQFAKALSPDQPVYGVRHKGEHSQDDTLRPVEKLAKDYAEEIRTLQSSGPYHLAGYSLGGWFAYAVATELKSHGAEVKLFLFDSYPSCRAPWPAAGVQSLTNALQFLRIFPNVFYQHIPKLMKMNVWEWPRYIANREIVRRMSDKLLRLLRLKKSVGVFAGSRAKQPGIYRFIEAVDRYSAESIQCDVELFQAPSPTLAAPLKMTQAMFWRSLVRGQVNLHQLDCGHGEIFSSAHIPKLAEMAELILEKANVSTPREKFDESSS